MILAWNFFLLQNVWILPFYLEFNNKTLLQHLLADLLIYCVFKKLNITKTSCGKQNSTLSLLDTRQWATKHNKSLAHKDKPLVQNKARKKITSTNGQGIRNQHVQLCALCKVTFSKMVSLLRSDRMKPYDMDLTANSLLYITQTIAN